MREQGQPSWAPTDHCLHPEKHLLYQHTRNLNITMQDPTCCQQTHTIYAFTGGEMQAHSAEPG